MKLESKAATLLLFPATAFLFAAMIGCKATAPVSAGPDAIFLAPEYPTLKLENLAYLGLATLEPDPVAQSTVDGLLQTYLMGGQQRFIVIDEESCRVRAQKAGVESDLDGVIRAWKDRHTVERFGLKKLGEKIGIDGIVFGDLTRWREEQVDWQSEGNSFTEVGISLLIYDAKTGILAWKGDRMQRAESAHYQHGSGATGLYQIPGTTTERTDKPDQIAPKPPDPKPVAESVVQSLISGLPDKPGPRMQATPQNP